MSAKDRPVSKPATDSFRENFDRIFGSTHQDETRNDMCGELERIAKRFRHADLQMVALGLGATQAYWEDGNLTIVLPDDTKFVYIPRSER